MSNSRKNSTEISEGRKTVFYLGSAVMAIGFILFFSTFFTSYFGTAVFGIIFIALGGFLQNIGREGLAGSGLLLDPKQAREDLKPHTTAMGGMLSDALEGMEENNPLKAREIIKIKCKNCGTLNDEDANFCKSCGQQL